MSTNFITLRLSEIKLCHIYHFEYDDYNFIGKALLYRNIKFTAINRFVYLQKILETKSMLYLMQFRKLYRCPKS